MSSPPTARGPAVLASPMIRGLALALAAALPLGLAACGSSSTPAPAPTAPKGPTGCARASDSMVAMMLARLPAGDPPPTEEADAIRNLIRERCEHDGWSAEAVQCLTAMKVMTDAEACAKLLTEDQQSALVSDERARFATPPAAQPPENQR